MPANFKLQIPVDHIKTIKTERDALKISAENLRTKKKQILPTALIDIKATTELMATAIAATDPEKEIIRKTVSHSVLTVKTELENIRHQTITIDEKIKALKTKVLSQAKAPQFSTTDLVNIFKTHGEYKNGSIRGGKDKVTLRMISLTLGNFTLYDINIQFQPSTCTLTIMFDPEGRTQQLVNHLMLPSLVLVKVQEINTKDLTKLIEKSIYRAGTGETLKGKFIETKPAANYIGMAGKIGTIRLGPLHGVDYTEDNCLYTDLRVEPKIYVNSSSMWVSEFMRQYPDAIKQLQLSGVHQSRLDRLQSYINRYVAK